MAANYPTSLDDASTLPTTIVPGAVGVGTEMDDGVPHSTTHNNLAGAVRELEAVVGIPASAVTTSHDYLIKQVALLKTIVDAKGDIVAATAADTVARLAVGSNGQVLTAASGQTTGVEWATPQSDPTLFLVDGTTYALTRTGIAAALTAADAVDGVVRICGDITLDGTSLAVPSLVTLDLGGHMLLAPAGAGSTDLVTITGTIGAAIALGSNATMGAKTIVLAAGGGASFAAGDIVRIFEETSRFYSQVAEIRSIATDTLTLVDSLKHAFTTANGTQIRKLTPVTGARVINGRFDANNNTGTTRAINAIYTVNCLVADCDFTDFPEAAVKFETGFHNEFRDIHFEDCGSASESDLMLFRQTDYHCIALHSHGAKGFAVQSSGGAGGEWVGCVTHDSAGRGFKLAYEGWTNVIGCRADGARNAYTGISVTLFSHDCDVIGSSAQGNASYGFMLDSTIRCRLIACRGQGNGTAEATHDDIDGTPSGNQFIDCAFDGGYNDSAAASDLLVTNTARRDFADFGSAPTVNGQLVRHGNTLKYYGTSAVDLLDKTPASHGASLHTDRTRQIALSLTPINYRDGAVFPAYSAGATSGWAIDSHGGVDSPHIDVIDNDASFPKFAFEGIPVPQDYVSGGKFVMVYDTPATSGNIRLAAGGREVLDANAGATTVLNEATSNVGIYDVAISGSANIGRKQEFTLAVQPVIGRRLHFFCWREANHANDTIADRMAFRHAYFEYTADM